MKNLKKLRERKGLTQAQVAGLLDVPVGTLRNWEQGIYAPRNIQTLEDIANILDCSIDELFGFEELREGSGSREQRIPATAYQSAIRELVRFVRPVDIEGMSADVREAIARSTEEK